MKLQHSLVEWFWRVILSFVILYQGYQRNQRCVELPDESHVAAMDHVFHLSPCTTNIYYART